ncbi:hypothetical protein FRC06_011839 [Ceratobasidium sp. 370]|nr:hypothetical protein FRC06_011839 [Ceratobasidium sp. 370]
MSPVACYRLDRSGTPTSRDLGSHTCRHGGKEAGVYGGNRTGRRRKTGDIGRACEDRRRPNDADRTPSRKGTGERETLTLRDVDYRYMDTVYEQPTSCSNARCGAGHDWTLVAPAWIPGKTTTGTWRRAPMDVPASVLDYSMRRMDLV